MPSVTLGPNQHTRIIFPKEGWINYFVATNIPVTSFVVNIEDFEKFLAAEKFDFQDGSHNKREHSGDLNLVPYERWYLVVVNASKEKKAKVYYEVSWA